CYGRFADWPQRCTPESIEKPGLMTGLWYFQHPEATEPWPLPEGGRWQARYSLLLVCNHGHLGLILPPAAFTQILPYREGPY
ncbi:hypothetical protein, partial [Aeromonas jandaei]|uniref:hypothetical protein n=1 Tax=Aeromonas jandaei TaxID=650 RepID=UPI001AE08799